MHSKYYPTKEGTIIVLMNLRRSVPRLQKCLCFMCPQEGGTTHIITYMYRTHTVTSMYLLSNFNHVSSWQHIQVRPQGTSLYGPAVPHVAQVLPKQYVIFQGGILDPSLLRHIRHTTLQDEAWH